jgi:hypothetical protein
MVNISGNPHGGGELKGSADRFIPPVMASQNIFWGFDALFRVASFTLIPIHHAAEFHQPNGPPSSGEDDEGI